MAPRGLVDSELSQQSGIFQKMLQRLLREKVLTEKFLHHSELNRSLNFPFTFALGSALSSLATPLHVITDAASRFWHLDHQ
ncbi:hypothetical protein KIN20_018041 [Parelaphostrongylus tenuis]|uniref:Uncharacterized protein n=1 Tax=Parelaphostrongylus tenuis TaxID=148309 RepID=A0AAD5N3T9_PARTN|nr:hypothetical protein KIN20_018041 [Parelaphostrongylus tenuis]